MFGRGSKRIGLSMDHSGVRYVLLNKKNKALSIDKSGFLAFPEGAIVEDQIIESHQISHLIKAWVKAEGLVGATATISIPTSQVIIRRMRIQTTNPKELQQLVELEVETTLHLPFEDPIYDYVVVGTDEVSTQLFIYAAPRKLINSYAKLLLDAGVQVRSAELSATAIARAITLQHDELFADTMLISMDEKLLEIYMFHDGYPIFMRDMSLEENDEDSIKGELSIEQVREISAEISRMLNFYQYSIYEGLSRITHIIVTGSTEGKQQLLSGLQQSLPDTINIRAVEFNSAMSEKSDAQTVNEYRIAVGLSLHEKNEKSISLLPNLGDDAKLRQLIMSVALIAWILIAATIGYFYYQNHVEIQTNTETKLEQNNQMAILAAKLSSDNKATGSETNPQVIIDEISARNPNIIASIDEINQKLPSRANLQRIAYSSSQFLITVIFNNMEDSARYLFDLRAISSISTANIQTISEARTGDTTSPNRNTTFSVTYELKFKKLAEGE